MRGSAILLAAMLFAIPLSSQTVAITGARVHTMGPQGTIENATLVMRDGRIVSVAAGGEVPAGARRIDARGKIVTPGLFNSVTGLGIVEVSAVDESVDRASDLDRITAAFDVAYALNPRSVLIAVNRADGLTRAVVAPQPGGSLIAGQGAVIHLGAGDPLVVRHAAMFAVLGERGAEMTGGARGAAMMRLREAFQDALDYAANRSDFEQGDRRAYSLSRLDLEALVPVVRGERPIVIAVNRASDIRAALALAQEFGLRLFLSGVEEGWVVAGEIASARVPVLVNPMSNLPSSFESIGATLENAARLRRAGVEVAFMTGDAHNARNVRQAAGNAVANGMAWDDALAAMTSVPARIWGIAARYGTLEPGKDADVVIWDGDPLELSTFPDAVFIRGVEMPRENRQTQLRDRYRDLSRWRR
jgi:imidazolonepropionase-like amidohydrolase